MNPPFCIGGTYDARDGGTPSSSAYVLKRDTIYPDSVRMEWIGPWKLGGVYSLVLERAWRDLAERQAHVLLFPWTVQGPAVDLGPPTVGPSVVLGPPVQPCPCGCHTSPVVTMHVRACCSQSGRRFAS